MNTIQIILLIDTILCLFSWIYSSVQLIINVNVSSACRHRPCMVTAENYNAAAIPEGTCQLLTLLVESTFLSSITTLDVAYIHSVSNDVMFQLHLYGDNTCIEWIDTDQLIKFQQIVMELTMFIQQRCGCSSSITTPRFTCHQSHKHHVTYRASVSTGSLSRQELVAVLEEWPRVHRSILLQGERLSVDNTCPIII